MAATRQPGLMAALTAAALSLALALLLLRQVLLVGQAELVATLGGVDIAVFQLDELAAFLCLACALGFAPTVLLVKARDTFRVCLAFGFGVAAILAADVVVFCLALLASTRLVGSFAGSAYTRWSSVVNLVLALGLSMHAFVAKSVDYGGLASISPADGKWLLAGAALTVVGLAGHLAVFPLHRLTVHVLAEARLGLAVSGFAVLPAVLGFGLRLLHEVWPLEFSVNEIGFVWPLACGGALTALIAFRHGVLPSILIGVATMALAWPGEASLALTLRLVLLTSLMSAFAFAMTMRTTSNTTSLTTAVIWALLTLTLGVALMPGWLGQLLDVIALDLGEGSAALALPPGLARQAAQKLLPVVLLPAALVVILTLVIWLGRDIFPAPLDVAKASRRAVFRARRQFAGARLRREACHRQELWRIGGVVAVAFLLFLSDT